MLDNTDERIMFNKEIKLKYIEQKNSTTKLPRLYLEMLFSKTENIESYLNKDVCEFNDSDILYLYKNMKKSSIDVLRNINSHLSMYTEWCIKNGITVNNHYINCETPQLTNCIYTNKEMFITRDQLLDLIEDLPNARDKFILLGLFEGIRGKEFEELTNVRSYDVGKYKIDLCTGRSIEPSKELYNIIIQSIGENRYYPVVKNREGIRYYTLKENGFVLKSYMNESDDVTQYQKGRNIYRAIRRNLEFLGIEKYITANTIQECGMIHYIKEAAIKNNRTFMEEFNSVDAVNIIRERFNKTLVRSSILSKYEDYLK